MATINNNTIDIKCRCGRTTNVKFKPATAYVELTRFMCDCSETFHIHDHYNGCTSYTAVTPETYDACLKMEEEERIRDKMLPDTEGSKKYQIVSNWLHTLSHDEVQTIDIQRTMKQVIDKEYVIETILEQCKYADKMLDELYRTAMSKSIELNPDEKDWCVIQVTDIRNSKLLCRHISKKEADEHIDELMDDEDNYDVSYACISVPLGTEITL